MEDRNTPREKVNTSSTKKKKEAIPTPSMNKLGNMMNYVTIQKKSSRSETNEHTHLHTEDTNNTNNINNKKEDN